ncbi:hypothetical protein Q3G72_033145 [Acer saccharum]|nr:hypothetical protein Q3G72_033145 [Acer saccharum]
MFARHRKEVNGSSRIGEDEDVLSLANALDNCEEEDELIKSIKALCVLNCGMHVYLKEAFLLDSIGYLSVSCLDLASWPDLSSSVSPKYQLANYLCLLWHFCVLHYIHVSLL